MVKYLRIYTLFFQSFFILSLAYADQLEKTNQWNWIPRDFLSIDQQAKPNCYCQGTYVDLWKPTDALRTKLNANAIYRNKDGVLHLEGNAQVFKPTFSLQANKIEGIPDQYYKIDGNATLSQKGQVIRGSSGYISNSDTFYTKFVDAKFTNILTRQRGAAKSLLRRKNGIIFIYKGYYTTCEPTQDSWKLYGNSIKLDFRTGYGIAENVQLRVHGVPVFYFPWLYLPLTGARQTGFLFPRFGFSNQKGLILSVPFYWNITSNFDATITPNLVTNKGNGFDLELRYLSQYGKTTYEQSSFNERNLNQNSEADGSQILIKLKTDQKLNQYFTTGLLYENNPTRDKYPDVNSTSIVQQDNYEQNAYLGFNSGNFLSKIMDRQYQIPNSTKIKPFNWKPRVDSSYQYATTYVDYSVDGQYTNFSDPSKILLDGKRNVLNQNIKLNLSNSWGTFSPGLLFQYRQYKIYSYTEKMDYKVSLSHASIYFDSSVIFDRAILINNSIWHQSLEPRLSYLNSPYTNQSNIPNFDTSVSVLNYSQAFSHQRFNGNDRIGDTKQFTLGIESRLYDSHNCQQWVFKLSQVQYLKDRYINITGDTNKNMPVRVEHQSPLLASVIYNGSDRLSLIGNVNYDLNKNKTNLSQVIVKTKPTNFVRLNMSYLYTVGNDDPVNDAKQASISTIFPVNQNWSMFLQLTHNFFKKENTKDIAGFGYENCCVKVSFGYQKWLNNVSNFENSIFLQFNLRSLSTVGQISLEPSVVQEYWNKGQVGYQ